MTWYALAELRLWIMIQVIKVKERDIYIYRERESEREGESGEKERMKAGKRLMKDHSRAFQISDADLHRRHSCEIH